MNIYLDEDSASGLLARLLRAAGHDIETPAQAGKRGAKDPVHLSHAIRSGRVLLTANHDDFKHLHQLVQDAEGHHPGILVVCRENDRPRDLTPHGIVRALSNLVAGGLPIENSFHVLNHFR